MLSAASICLFLCPCLVGQVSADAPAATKAAAAGPASEEADIYWSGMLAERQRMHSGIVRARGRKIDSSPALGRVEGEVDLFCAFDRDGERLRFDRFEPGRFELDPAKPPPKGSEDQRRGWTLGTQGGRVIRIPGKLITQVAGSTQVSISGDTSNFKVTARPFDMRGIGLYLWSALGDPKFDLNELARGWMNRPPAEVASEGADLVRLTWKFPINPEANDERTLWLDRAHGFTPVRFEQRPVGTVNGQKRQGRIGSLSNVTWKPHGGTWVPETMRLEENPGTPHEQIVELAFDWKSVNEPVPDTLFSLEGLELARNTTIVDYQLGRPVLVGEIGERHAPVIDAAGAASLATIATNRNAENRRWMIIAGINAAVLAGLVGVRIARRRPTPRPSIGA